MESDKSLIGVKLLYHTEKTEHAETYRKLSLGLALQSKKVNRINSVFNNRLFKASLQHTTFHPTCTIIIIFRARTYFVMHFWRRRTRSQRAF